MTSLKKNSEFEVEVVDLTHEGLGVVRVEDFPFFVENALPGEKIRIALTKIGKNFGFARLLEILESSPERENSGYTDYLRTGIADLGHLKYPAQLAFKQRQVKENLRKIAGLTELPVLKTLGAEETLHYRNKAQIPVRMVKGQLETGFFRKNSHDLLPIEDFYIQDKEIDRLILFLRDAFRAAGLSAFDEKSGKGLIRNIVIRRGHYSGEMMLILVLTADKMPEAILKACQESFPELKSIYLNLNQSKGNAIFGSQWKILAGQATISDQMLGKTFQIAPASFYQVNTAQAEVLYQTAYDFANLKSSDIIIDAYSGIGTVGLAVAERVKAVYGMEVITAAVENAKANAELNQISNSHYEVGKAEEVMPKWLEQGIQPDVIFVDPPRKGLEESFIETASQMKARSIVYISCNPSTFARDVARFAKLGYRLEKVQPVDLFPQTHHIECVGLFSPA